MSFIVTQTIGGEPVTLLLFPHNWKADFLLDVSFPSGLETTLSGEEDRYPESSSIRLSAHYQTAPRDEAAQALRELRSSYAGELLAAPIYSEAYLATEYAEKVRLSASYVINYDASRNFQIYPAHSLPTSWPYPTAAPLLFGKFAAADPLKAYDGHHARTSYTLEEDSPSGFGFSARSSILPASWPADLRPNWARPVEEDVENALRRESYGQRRQKAVSGSDFVPRLRRKFTLQLKGSAIRSLIDFLSSRKGITEAFSAPAYFAPGTPSLLAPHSTTCRFAAPRVRLSFSDRDYAASTLELIQLPWEINPERVYSLPRRVWLVKLVYHVPGSPTRYLTTSDGSVPFGGDSYLPGFIKPGTFRESLDNWSRITYELTIRPEPDDALLSIHRGERNGLYSIDLYSADPDDAENTAFYHFSGTLEGTETKGDDIKARFIVAGGLFERELGHYVYKPDCNAEVFSPACGVAQEDHEAPMTVSAIGEKTIDLSYGTARPLGYFRRGFIETGAGVGFQRRAILDSSPISGGVRLTLDRDFAAIEISDPVTVLPGCSGEKDECFGKFGNFQKMPAHVAMPKDNPTVKTFDFEYDSAGKK